MRSLFPHRPLTVAAISLACAAIAPAARAGHSWNGYHWAGNGSEFTLKPGDNVSSVWDPYLVTSRLDWSVSGDLDTTMLGLIYAHNDGTSTVNQSAQLPAALSDADVSEPSQWGKLVKKSRNGKHETYARDLGGGYAVHTFVIWTDEKGDRKKD